MLIPRGVPEEENTMTVWTDSDWAGDVASRRSTSGGVIAYRGAIMAHWSKSQSNIALSSAEAELNATVKGLSEIVGLHNLIEETQKVSVNLVLCTDASACKGMLLRHGTGKVKHLSVKQLWAQECVRAYDVQIQRVPREQNPSDVLTHSVSHPIMETQMERLNVRRGPVQWMGAQGQAGGSPPTVAAETGNMGAQGQAGGSPPTAAVEVGDTAARQVDHRRHCPRTADRRPNTPVSRTAGRRPSTQMRRPADRGPDGIVWEDSGSPSQVITPGSRTADRRPSMRRGCRQTGVAQTQHLRPW